MRRYLLLLAAGLLGAAACRQDDIPQRHGRVLLAYMAVDNNLGGLALEKPKLQGLREGWTQNPEDHIVIYTDTPDGGACLLEYSNLPDGAPPRRIAAYGDADSADPALLAEVIRDVRNAFPEAGSYGLIVFSHGWGWLPGLSFLDPGAWEPTRSIIVDDHPGYHLTMEWSELAEAIPDGLFDYIVLEACFTAGIEVAWELRDEAPLILGSSAEIIDPGFAPVYARATHYLFDKQIIRFGQTAFDHMLSYPDGDVRGSATCSVIRTDRLEALAEFIRTYCDFTKAVDVNDLQRFDREDARLFFDFEDYYGRLLDTDARRAELGRLIAACVPWKAATETFMMQGGGDSFAIEQHSGLTTYVPQPAFPALNAAYDTLPWARACRP